MVVNVPAVAPSSIWIESTSFSSKMESVPRSPISMKSIGLGKLPASVVLPVPERP